MPNFCYETHLSKEQNIFANYFKLFKIIIPINITFGGLKGYVSGTLISSTNLPPSYGVSGGPAISPRNSVQLSLISSILMEH